MIRASSPALRFPKQLRSASVVFERTKLRRTSMDVDTAKTTHRSFQAVNLTNNSTTLPWDRLCHPLSQTPSSLIWKRRPRARTAGAGEDIAPSVWKRYAYADDRDIVSVVIRNKGHLPLEYLNAQREKIRFTMEEEKDGPLPVTDISFFRHEYGQVVREVFHKPTHATE